MESRKSTVIPVFLFFCIAKRQKRKGILSFNIRFPHRIASQKTGMTDFFEKILIHSWSYKIFKPTGKHNRAIRL
jgi:hypothetical protein